MYKLTVISQPALEQNTVDTKQQKNGKSIMEYNSIVLNTPILHITIFLHIHTLLMQHLQVTCTCLKKVDVTPGFLAVKWTKSDQAGDLCWSLLVPVKCRVISIWLMKPNSVNLNSEVMMLFSAQSISNDIILQCI